MGRDRCHRPVPDRRDSRLACPGDPPRAWGPGSVVANGRRSCPPPAPARRSCFCTVPGTEAGAGPRVLARVTGAGTRALAVDMAGHGLRARHPAALTRRPFDASLLASEPSPVADVGLDQAGE